MKPAAAKMTYDQYCLLPEDGKQHELIDGELFVTPAPTPRHQRFLGKLYSQLSAYVETNSLGEVFVAPVDIVLDKHTVVQPDVLFISQDRLGIMGEQAIEKAPDLVVEILSPSTFYKDLRRKMAAYFQFGVQEYWIVDPEKQTIELYGRTGQELQLIRLFSSHESLESPLLPGFRLAVSRIF
ncbi:MAG: Uma2 family endonuclease [Acidobacteria bacterium]|nr:Uma2 family endonuclease [Acidobacteriota bacterium]